LYASPAGWGLATGEDKSRMEIVDALGKIDAGWLLAGRFFVG